MIDAIAIRENQSETKLNFYLALINCEQINKVDIGLLRSFKNISIS